MNENIKIEKYYNREKLLKAIFKMEQFHLLSKKEDLEEKTRICAQKLEAHYRRLAMAIIVKEIPNDIDTELYINEDYLKNVFKQYA